MSRSYAVRTEDGRLFRRNRRHLRQSKEQFVAKDADVEIPSPVTNCPQPEVYTEPSAAPAQNSTGNPTPLHSKETGQGLSPTTSGCQDPMPLELKMAGYSDETADICDSRKNSSWLKMLMLKFQVQLQSVHNLKSTQNHQHTSTEQHRRPNTFVQ